MCRNHVLYSIDIHLMRSCCAPPFQIQIMFFDILTCAKLSWKKFNQCYTIDVLTFIISFATLNYPLNYFLFSLYVITNEMVYCHLPPQKIDVFVALTSSRSRFILTAKPFSVQLCGKFNWQKYTVPVISNYFRRDIFFLLYNSNKFWVVRKNFGDSFRWSKNLTSGK